MANVNKIILLGNLTRDVNLKYLPSQTAVAEFGLAVNHKYKTANGEQRDEAMFIDCACFGKGGELIKQYCSKGDQLYVEGRLKLDVWEDKNGGGRRSKHVMIVEDFQFLGGRQSSGPTSRGNRPADRPSGPAEGDDIPV